MTWDYTALLERAPMWMAVVDRQANCCDLSAPWRSHLGLASTSDVQLPLTELLASAEASARGVLLKAVTDRDTIEAMPTRLAGSGPVTGDLWQWPAPPDADAAAFIFVSFSGRQLAKAMNQSIQDLVLDAAGEGIYGLDEDGRTTFVNRAATEILGWREQDLLGEALHDIHHHSYPDGTPYRREDCPIYAALKDGKVHREDEEVFWHADGRAIPVEYISTPIRKEDGLAGAGVVFRDVSERRVLEQQREQARSELFHLHRRQQLILEAAGEGIYGLDSEGRATFANKAATEILGWREQDIVGQPLHDVHHHSYADGTPYPREECPIYLALTDGKVHREESEVFWHADGSAIPVEYTSTPIREDGEVTGAVVVFRDISERRRLEEQRKQDFDEISRLKEQLELERDYLRDEIRVSSHYRGIIGESRALKRTLEQIEAVAGTPVSVLIRGETGVGKENIARAIHDHSDRTEQPLVKVNCASIPAELFESEFFGHVQGAFTGAHRDRVGRLQLADGGTLFLDEVGEIPLSLQGKLLRALQEHEFERVGDDRTVNVDVRVVAATNRDLEDEIRAGRFREDLYYRLSVFPIEVPPLRERLDDLGPLTQHFLDSICEELGREPISLTKQQLATLKSHDWPGNVRELKNAIERAVILTRGTRLRLDLAFTPSEPPPVADMRPTSTDFVTDSEIREMEKANLLAALRHANGRLSGTGGAAELLGLKPSTLAYRLKKFNVPKPGESGDRG